MEIKGRVIQSLGVQKGTSKAGKEWSKASIIVETDGQYPKKVALDNLKNAEEFAKLAVGTEGVFHIEVESREFNGRWYTNVNCWKWEMDQAQPSAQQPQSSTPTLDSLGVNSSHPQPATAPADDSDLPF